MRFELAISCCLGAVPTGVRRVFDFVDNRQFWSFSTISEPDTCWVQFFEDNNNKQSKRTVWVRLFENHQESWLYIKTSSLNFFENYGYQPGSLMNFSCFFNNRLALVYAFGDITKISIFFQFF